MIHFFLGRSYFNLRKYREAETHYRKAIQIKPDYALARLNLARTCDALGDHKSALQEYRTVETDHPGELSASDKKRIDALSETAEVPQDMEVSSRMPSDAQSVPPKAAAIESVANRGLSTVEKKYQRIEVARYFAVLIGVADYDDPAVIDLDQPVNDIVSLQKILSEKYTFAPERIQVLKNPTREDILTTFQELITKITPKDNLLIFYAGHGYYDEKIKAGFWLPRDARKDKNTNWIRNGTIRDYIGGINSRHTLLIADACFSGSIFKTRNAFDRSTTAIEELYKLPSRKAMTSGTMTEVPDKSVFVELLLKRLADNEKKYTTSQVIFAKLQLPVSDNSPTGQVPQWGTIHRCGDEGGDFIFIRRTR